jgi:3D (Asp-Asp-Asp) domain-containing protein
MKSLFGGSAIAAAALLTAFLLFAAKPSVAETAVSQSQQTILQPSEIQKQDPVVTSSAVRTTGKAVPEIPIGKIVASPKAGEIPVSLPVHYVATAYSLRGRTASGKFVSQGIVAADPRVLPLGSRVHLQAGAWSGEYLVADTGGAIKGRRIDIWTPSTREAMRFGRRTVKLTVLSYGGKRSAAKRRIQI